jgi:hypothetical protein
MSPATVNADGTSSGGGTETVTATATGGNGGSAFNGATGGNGASVSLTSNITVAGPTIVNGSTRGALQLTLNGVAGNAGEVIVEHKELPERQR